MNDSTQISASREQVSCELEGDTVILNLKNGTYYELNAVATRVWDLLQTPTNLAQLTNAIVDEYDAASETVHRDLIALLRDLRKHELIVVHEGSNADAQVATA